MAQRTAAIILLTLTLFSFSARPAEAHCKWKHPHHCVKDIVEKIPIVNKIVEVVADVVDVAVRIVVTPIEAVVDLIKDGKTDAFKKTAESFGELGESLLDLGKGIVKTVVNAVGVVAKTIELAVKGADCLVKVSKIWGGTPSCDKVDELANRIRCQAGAIDESFGDKCAVDCNGNFTKWR